LNGTWPRQKLNLATGQYEIDPDRAPYHGVIVGARADEEGSRSKERYFSPRDKNSAWDVGEQPPEFWNQFKTDFAPGTHVRIHPLLDWTELHIWEYIKRENIPTVSLYYDQGRAPATAVWGVAPAKPPFKVPPKTWTILF
jgi:sulfate adenylyltransferase subunit 2